MKSSTKRILSSRTNDFHPQDKKLHFCPQEGEKNFFQYLEKTKNQNFCPSMRRKKERKKERKEKKEKVLSTKRK